MPSYRRVGLIGGISLGSAAVFGAGTISAAPIQNSAAPSTSPQENTVEVLADAGSGHQLLDFDGGPAVVESLGMFHGEGLSSWAVPQVSVVQEVPPVKGLSHPIMQPKMRGLIAENTGSLADSRGFSFSFGSPTSAPVAALSTGIYSPPMEAHNGPADCVMTRDTKISDVGAVFRGTGDFSGTKPASAMVIGGGVLSTALTPGRRRRRIGKR